MYKMHKISTEAFSKNYVYNIVDNEKKLQLRNKDIGEKLGVENIIDLIDKEIKSKFYTKNPTNDQIREYKRHGSELIGGEKFMYTREDILMIIIMSFRVSTPKAIEFRSKLGFKERNIILTKERSVISKIAKLFSNEKVLLQHSVLDYKIDLYFAEHKLAIEVDEKRHTDRDKIKEIEQQEVIEKKLGCKFIRIDLDEKDYDEYAKFGKVNNHINELTKN